MGHRSVSWKHADLVVAGGIEAFIRTRRDEGKGWRVIARELWLTTGGEVDITHETLRRWYDADADGGEGEAA